MDEIAGQIYDFLRPILDAKITIGSGVTLTPGSVMMSLLILVIFNAFARILQRIIKARVLPRFQIDVSTEYLILKLLHYFTMGVALLIVFGTLGFDLSSVTVIAGLLSVGIGFGLQTLAANFVSGLILLFEAPVKIGDWLQIGELEGVVMAINLRYTGIETVDGIYILVPNQDLITSQVINGSKGPPYVRIHTPVGVSYNSDMKVVEAALLEVAKSHPKVLQSPPPQVWWTGFGDSSVDFRILTWIESLKDRPGVQSDLYRAAWWSLKEKGIEIPFPQRDLHLRSSDVPLPIRIESGRISDLREH